MSVLLRNDFGGCVFKSAMLSLVAATLIVRMPFLTSTFSFAAVSTHRFFATLNLTFLVVPLIRVIGTVRHTIVGGGTGGRAMGWTLTAGRVCIFRNATMFLATIPFCLSHDNLVLSFYSSLYCRGGGNVNSKHRRLGEDKGCRSCVLEDHAQDRKGLRTSRHLQRRRFS